MAIIKVANTSGAVIVPSGDFLCALPKPRIYRSITDRGTTGWLGVVEMPTQLP